MSKRTIVTRPRLLPLHPAGSWLRLIDQLAAGSEASPSNAGTAPRPRNPHRLHHRDLEPMRNSFANLLRAMRRDEADIAATLNILLSPAGRASPP